MSSGLIVLLTCLSLALVACGIESEPLGTVTLPTSTTVDPTPSLGGDRLPVQMPGENYGHYPSRISGTLLLQSNGCWSIDIQGQAVPIVFPVGTTKPATDGSTMRAADGTDFSTGMEVDAIGGIVSVENFPGIPDGFWGSYFSFCNPDSTEIVVVDSVSPAFQPGELTYEQQVAMLTETDLDTSWACGLGFTLSNDEQTVALYVWPTDSGFEPVPPATLPDARWDAEVVIGKNLLVNHCDDVLEFWEPPRVVVADWPVVAGALDFEVPTEACAGGDPVVATFNGVTVDTDSGLIGLGDLTMVNSGYGCFAG